MNIYKKMYLLLFNSITDAIQDLHRLNFGEAIEKLVTAQQATEDLYLESAGEYRDPPDEPTGPDDNRSEPADVTEEDPDEDL